MKTITFEEIQEEKTIYYDVSFEEEKVTQFCDYLKENASHTIHYDYIAIHGPYDKNTSLKTNDNNHELFNTYTISNYKKTPVIDDKERKMVSLEYRFEYDVHYLPFLLVLIDKLINGSKKAFFEIMYPSFKNEFIPIRDEISRKERQYMDLDEKNSSDIVSQKLKVLDEIKEMLLKIQEGDYDIPIRKYYEEFQKLLTVEQRIVPKIWDNELKNR